MLINLNIQNLKINSYVQIEIESICITTPSPRARNKSHNG